MGQHQRNFKFYASGDLYNQLIQNTLGLSRLLIQLFTELELREDLVRDVLKLKCDYRTKLQHLVTATRRLQQMLAALLQQQAALLQQEHQDKTILHNRQQEELHIVQQ